MNIFVKLLMIAMFMVLIIPEKQNKPELTFSKWKKEKIRKQKKISKKLGL